VYLLLIHGDFCQVIGAYLDSRIWVAGMYLNSRIIVRTHNNLVVRGMEKPMSRTEELIKQIKLLTAELEIELAKEKELNIVTHSYQIALNIKEISTKDWDISQQERYVAMRPIYNKSKIGRRLLFIEPSRNHYCALSLHKDIALIDSVIHNEVKPSARLCNTRKFVFNDHESLISFLISNKVI
jgi:hypothetical protein